MGRNKISLPIDKIVKEYISTNASMMELGAKYNTSDTTIRKILRESGVESRPSHRVKGKRIKPRAKADKSDLEYRVEMYRNAGLNDMEIACLTDVSIKDIMSIRRNI